MTGITYTGHKSIRNRLTPKGVREMPLEEVKAADRAIDDAYDFGSADAIDFHNKPILQKELSRRWGTEAGWGA